MSNGKAKMHTGCHLKHVTLSDPPFKGKSRQECRDKGMFLNDFVLEDSMFDRLRHKLRYRYHVKSKDYAITRKNLIEKTMTGFGQEARETKQMAQLFFKLLQNKLRLNERKEPPTEKEVKAAIEQLKDIGRISVFASVSILPGGGISLIGLELLARKFGVKNFTFIPTAFRKKKNV